MITIIFDKARADYLLDNLNGDKPIEPPPGGWTQEAMMALAAAAFYVAHGHARFFAKLHEERNREQRDAREQGLLNDHYFALGQYIDLTDKVNARTASGWRLFDKHYEPHVEMVAAQYGDRHKVTVTSGEKKPSA